MILCYLGIVPIALPDVDVSEETKLQPPYNVVLLDDQDHTYEYVIEMLGRVFGYGKQKAYKMACEVDIVGRCIVFTGSLNEAELNRDKIHAYGKDWRIPACKGSMSAIIESVEE